MNLSRRHFLQLSALAAPLASTAWAGDEPPPRRPRVAAVYTVFRFRSHAFNILENFLTPYLFNGKRVEPSCQVVSFYADQRVPEGDMTDAVARRFKIPVYKTIREALTLGGKELAVDAVLAIGEHGEYPVNKLGQKEYPRKRFFDEIVAVMRQSNRYVPMFNDKHLSYRWDWAREMYDVCRRNRLPYLAGSSVPLAERRPALEKGSGPLKSQVLTPFPHGAAIEEAVSIHGGGLETYDFHGLEVLQSLIEGRKGGETGVASIEFLAGDALIKAGRQGRFSMRLVQAAMAAEFGDKPPNPKDPLVPQKGVEPHGLLISYRDGLRAAVLKVGASSVRWNFACQLARDDRLHATRFYVGPYGNRCLFMALSNAIQNHFVHRRPPYPVERTLLTTGLVEAAVRSRADGRRLETPHLHLAYEPRDFRAMREMGASWKALEGQPEPKSLGLAPAK
jgi:hypothetical protein